MIEFYKNYIFINLLDEVKSMNTVGNQSEHSNPLSSLPRVDDLLERYASCGLQKGYLKQIIQNVLESCRKKVLTQQLSSSDSVKESVDRELNAAIRRLQSGSIRHVINGTGLILHTNLGRAVYEIDDFSFRASHYCNLEFDLERGERGSRNAHISEFLKLLTGAEAAIAVNNNAAAVMLVLTALCKDREVLVSRGEQVEIGGSFRIPEVARLSGAVLKEIGTTNRTRISDYEEALSESTGMVLRVEPSNYAVIGQTGRPINEEIYRFSSEKGIPYYIDLGSGVFDLSALSGAVRAEEASKKDIRNAVSNADLVSFSGDKLLGSAQAGIIIGKKKYVDLLAKHPLYRAMRLDKLSIYALSETFRSILFGKMTLVDRMISTEVEEIKNRVQNFIKEFRQSVKKTREYNKDVEVDERFLTAIPIQSGIGGGTFAFSEIPSHGVELKVPKTDANLLAKTLRTAETPLICRVEGDALIIDFRTIMPDEEEMLKKILTDLLYNITFT